MDGRLMIEDGTILDLLRTDRRRQPLGRRRQRPQGAQQGQAANGAPLFRRNEPPARARNVAHHYDLGNELYELFLDDDLQYSCAYFTDPGNSLEQAQADKKAHIAAKLHLKPGQRVLDIGCGLGRDGALPEPRRRRRRARHHLVARSS